MSILERVEHLKNMAANHGEYRDVAIRSGVTFHWLQKFAIGAIHNPGVQNIAKLEAFFLPGDEKDAA